MKLTLTLYAGPCLTFLAFLGFFVHDKNLNTDRDAMMNVYIQGVPTRLGMHGDAHRRVRTP